MSNSWSFLAIFLLLAIVIFGTHKKNNFEDTWVLGWSYYVTCVACLFSMLHVYATCKVGGVTYRGRNESSRTFDDNERDYVRPQKTQKDLSESSYPKHFGEIGEVVRDNWNINDHSFFATAPAHNGYNDGKGDAGDYLAGKHEERTKRLSDKKNTISSDDASESNSEFDDDDSERSSRKSGRSSSSSSMISGNSSTSRFPTSSIVSSTAGFDDRG